jgi:purine nucleosidase
VGAASIIVDCDPGVDDAVALLLALAAPDALDVLGITTVAGNRPLPVTTRNARRIAAFAGRTDISVVAGCARPLLAEAHTTTLHGEDGLGGVDLPDSRAPEDLRHGADFIVDTVRARPARTVTLFPLGPLTNVALALARAPDIATRLERIMLMGGAAFVPGNITPAAEFNVFVDPHAAEIVFRSGAPVTMFGLDVTRQVAVTPPRLSALARAGAAGALAAAMLRGFAAEAPLLHDPCVIAALLMPALFSGVDAHVAVELASPLTRGQTIACADPRHLGTRHPDCRVITGVDADGFFDLLAGRLAQLPG